MTLSDGIADSELRESAGDGVSLAGWVLRARHSIRLAGEQLVPLRLVQIAAGDLAGVGLPGVGARVPLEDLARAVDEHHAVIGEELSPYANRPQRHHRAELVLRR